MEQAFEDFKLNGICGAHNLKRDLSTHPQHI
jgi:hypothetical protein